MSALVVNSDVPDVAPVVRSTSRTLRPTFEYSRLFRLFAIWPFCATARNVNVSVDGTKRQRPAEPPPVPPSGEVDP